MKIKEKVFNFLNYLFIEDIKCIVCGKEICKNSRYCMCDKCKTNLPYIIKGCSLCGEKLYSGRICLKCKNEPVNIVKNISVFEYVYPINNLIYELKYNDKQYIAKYLSTFLVDKYIESNLNIDLIIPVAMNINRLKQRGFNQAELLCSGFKGLGIKVESNVVTRIVDTPNQANLKKEQRLINLSGAFRVENKEIVKNKTILIIDDVYTTGTTINEIAKVLLNAGAKEVYSLTVAHSENKIKFE